MEFKRLSIDGAFEIISQTYIDERGFLSEFWKKSVFQANGLDVDFVQDNYSWSKSAGTIRGLHFQLPPYAQAKLVRVTRGTAFDVIVDLRVGSPSFGEYVTVMLSSYAFNQLFIPIGCAHGFLTLEDDTHFQYKMTAEYSVDHEATLHYADSNLDIDWPIGSLRLIVSEKDRSAGSFEVFESPFLFEEGT